MEGMNWWINSQEDLAIRRFCPERVNQQLEDQSTLMLNEMELSWSPLYDTINITSHDEDNLVDSFFNIENDDHNTNDNSDHDHSNNLYDHVNGVDFTQFQDELEHFSPMDGVFGYIDMAIEGGQGIDEFTSNSFEDFEVINSPKLEPCGGHDQESSIGTHGVDQGLGLVHLLLACAEAVGCRDTLLAETMLNQIWPMVSPWGDSLQRVSYCFATGLKTRLSLLQNLNSNGIFSDGALDFSLINKEEKMEAFHLFHQATPYMAFGFMAANVAISQSALGEEKLHIIDLGMEHTLQWASLLKTLASRAEGPPKLLRITGLVDNEVFPFELETSIDSLIQEAGSLGILLEVNMISEPLSVSLLTKEKLALREGEALFVNSILHLHEYVKESRGSLKAILQAMKKLGPTLLTIVEQDANHNGPFFLGRFLESLHYYSAIFDSLEASLPRDSLQRVKIENFLLLEQIRNIIAYEGSDRIERHERVDQWRRQLGRAGFKLVGLKSMNQARMMISSYGPSCDGYTLTSDKGCLLLGWKGRPIMLASASQIHC